MKQEATQTNNSFFKKLEDLHTYEAILETNNAFKNALLLVSVSINVAVLVTWIVLQLA